METNIVKMFTPEQFPWVREWSPLTRKPQGPPEGYAVSVGDLFSPGNDLPLLVAWADTTGLDEDCKHQDADTGLWATNYRRRLWVVCRCDILEGFDHYSLVRLDSLRPNKPSVGIASTRQYRQPVQPTPDTRQVRGSIPWPARRLVSHA